MLRECRRVERTNCGAFLQGTLANRRISGPEMQGDEEAEYHALLNQRMKAMDAGKKVMGEEVERRHNKLQAQGR